MCSGNFNLMRILFPHFSWLQEEGNYSNGLLSEACLNSKSVLCVEGQSAIIPCGMSKLYFEVDHLGKSLSTQYTNSNMNIPLKMSWC